jgi:mRNA interferase RelE/StbE
MAPAAVKQMRSLQPSTNRRLNKAIEALGENPRPSGSVKMKVDGSYRIRVGDYRVIYDVDDARRSVLVTAVRHRREAYR